MKMVNDLEAIKKRRRFLRKSVADTLKSIDEALSIPDNHARIQVLKDNIANKWNDLQEVQASMYTLLEEKEIDEECESHNEYELRVIEYMAKTMHYLESKHVGKESAASNSTAAQAPLSLCPKVQVKLPKIDLPTFDGDVSSWQSYYQSIKVSVVDNPSLAGVQKLEYLMRSLKGSAAEAVKGFAVIRENYQPVLESLKERFGHSRLILDAHIRSLIHLPQLNSEDALFMRKFYEQVVGHVRSVESMGEKFRSETLVHVLVPLIVDKLPKRVVEKWELEIGDLKEDYVKVKTLFAFLEQLIRAKESSQPPSLQSKSSAQENSWNHRAHSKSNPSRKYSTSALTCARQLKGVRASFVVKTIGCGRASVSCHCQSKKDSEKRYPKAYVFDALNLVTELKFVKNHSVNAAMINIRVSCTWNQSSLSQKKPIQSPLNHHPHLQLLPRRVP